MVSSTHIDAHLGMVSSTQTSSRPLANWENSGTTFDGGVAMICHVIDWGVAVIYHVMDWGVAMKSIRSHEPQLHLIS